MTRIAQTVSGYWRELNGGWRWIKPYHRYANGVGVTLSLDAGAPTHDPPPGELAPETLAEFGHLLERDKVTSVDFSRVLARPRRRPR